MTLTARNIDSVPHDVVLVRTARQPDRLPVIGARVDETVEVLARTASLRPHGAGSLSAVVEPGTYVQVCTVPHHSTREAMVATPVVTG